jgi:hypothetical protein
MIARIFTLCVPFVGSLAIYWKPLPLVALGVPTALAGLLALVLPETAGKDLPQTIQEADQNRMSISAQSFKDLVEASNLTKSRRASTGNVNSNGI